MKTKTHDKAYNTGNSKISAFVRKHTVWTCLASVILLAAMSSGYFFFTDNLRFDQHMNTICGTTAAIVSTMFGLTAASYAFVWGDLRTEMNEHRYRLNVLNRYKDLLWTYFKYTLFLMIVTVFTSLFVMGTAQELTTSELMNVTLTGGRYLAEYANSDFKMISSVVFANLISAVAAIIIMAIMNYLIFKREDLYETIASAILYGVMERYECGQPIKKISGNVEYEKIHNLERLIDRIMKNHECIGEAFAENKRRENQLSMYVSQVLEIYFHVNSDGASDDTDSWNHLNYNKRQSRIDLTQQKARDEYNSLKGSGGHEANNKKKPIEHGFVRVYEDLITYRNNKLIYDNGPDGSALRHSIKRRTLIFLLREENLSGMDLSNISFSGADLQHTNFSDSNLTRVRLKGANCAGADFTRARMPGIYFSDSAQCKICEIALTYLDDNKETWDPYKGRERTCLTEATFTEADVSRAHFDVPGNLVETESFPYIPGKDDDIRPKIEGEMFSLVGTNFDRAKMYSSRLRNINLTNSSLEGAMMFNVILIQCCVKNANFSKALMTNSILSWCNFRNSNLQEAVLSQSILLRSCFHGTRMQNANFTYSNIVACSFEGAYCQKVSFKNMKQELDDINAKLEKENVEVGGADYLSFCFATLTDTDFTKADLKDARFSNAVGTDCMFSETRGKGAVFDDAFFTSSIFNQSRFISSSFKRTILRNSVITAATFKDCEFDYADFSNSLFNTGDSPCFIYGHIKNVRFVDAQGLSVNCFYRVRIENTDFRGTNVKRSDLRKCNRIKNCIFD